MRSFSQFVIALVLSTVGVAAQTQPQLTVIAPNTTNTTLGPRTLTPSIVSCTDLPTHTTPASPLHVVAAQAGTDKTNYATGEIVVLNGGTPQGLGVGQRYFVRHLQLGLTAEPPSATALAPIRTAGWLTVIAADERFALARIDFACDAIEAGDYLDPFLEPELPANVPPDGAPNFNDMGRVLFGPDRRTTFGAGDIANIDRGKAHGIGVGTRVAFYRDRQNGTPLVEMGAGIVVEIAEQTAKVVLVRANEQVERGDYVAVRGTAVPPK
jgi:hypothetical protein